MLNLCSAFHHNVIIASYYHSRARPIFELFRMFGIRIESVYQKSYLEFLFLQFFCMLDFVLHFFEPLVAICFRLFGFSNLLVQLLTLLFKFPNFFSKTVMSCALQSFTDEFQLVSFQFVLWLFK